MVKVFKALGHKVREHKELKQDLVKRYWVHNHDEENNTFKDEFFPVTVCTQRKLLKYNNDQKFLVLNDRTQVHVKYQFDVAKKFVD